MKQLVAALAMASLIAHAYADAPPSSPQGPSETSAPPQAVSNATERAGALPGASAASAAEGNLTPVYVGATVAGAAVLVGALTGGGSHPGNDSTGGTGGTSGTTGTTGTR